MWNPQPVILPNGMHIGSATASLGALNEFTSYAHRVFRWRYVDGRSEEEVRNACFTALCESLGYPADRIVAFALHEIEVANGETINAWQLEQKNDKRPWKPGDE